MDANIYDQLNKILMDHIAAPSSDSKIERNPKGNGEMFDSADFIKVRIALSTEPNSNYIQTEAILDTGANVSILINEALLEDFKQKAELLEPVGVLGITGEIEPHDRTTVYMKLGNHMPIKTSAIISKKVPKILIGCHILKVFDLSIIDGVATLTPKKQIQS